jgi:hypothetical protein
MQILVKNVYNQTKVYDMDEMNTIYDLKCKIEEEENMSIENQRLLCGVCELRNKDKINKLNGIIELSFRLLGGRAKKAKVKAPKTKTKAPKTKTKVKAKAKAKAKTGGMGLGTGLLLGAGALLVANGATGGSLGITRAIGGAAGSVTKTVGGGLMSGIWTLIDTFMTSIFGENWKMWLYGLIFIVVAFFVYKMYKMFF